jgi:hypothetical protein
MGRVGELVPIRRVERAIAQALPNRGDGGGLERAETAPVIIKVAERQCVSEHSVKRHHTSMTRLCAESDSHGRKFTE